MVRRKVLIDIGPLRRSKDFRYLFFGELVSLIGSGLTVVAVPFQLFSLTGSSLQVGLASLAQLVPLIACSFVGGAIADTYDRRRVLLVAEVAMAGCSAALALNSTVGSKPEVWPIYLFSAALAGLSGIESPTRVAAAASVLDRSDLTQMGALFQALFQTSSVVGPFLAGIVISTAGLGAAYWADVASFGAAFAGAWLLRPLPPAHQVTAMGWKAVKEGFRFLRGDRALQNVYLIDLVAMVLGMPRALFPAIGTVLFHGGARTVSYLYTAVSAGALVGALATGWVAHVKRQGRAVVIAVLVWGASIAAFGLVGSLPGRARVPGRRRLGRRGLSNISQLHPPTAGPGPAARAYERHPDGRGGRGAQVGRLRIGRGGHAGFTHLRRGFRWVGFDGCGRRHDGHHARLLASSAEPGRSRHQSECRDRTGPRRRRTGDLGAPSFIGRLFSRSL